jgi:hypothetical protein
VGRGEGGLENQLCVAHLHPRLPQLRLLAGVLSTQDQPVISLPLLSFTPPTNDTTGDSALTALSRLPAENAAWGTQQKVSRYSQSATLAARLCQCDSATWQAEGSASQAVLRLVPCEL